MGREFSSINTQFARSISGLIELDSMKLHLPDLNFYLDRYNSRPEGSEILPRGFFIDLFTMISDYLNNNISNNSRSFIRYELFKLLTYCYLVITQNNLFVETIYRPTFQEVFKKLCSKDKWIFNGFSDSYQLLWSYFEGLNMQKRAIYRTYRSDIFSPPPLKFNELQIFEKKILNDYVVDRVHFDIMDLRFITKINFPCIENVASSEIFVTLKNILIEHLSIEEIEALVPRMGEFLPATRIDDCSPLNYEVIKNFWNCKHE